MALNQITKMRLPGGAEVALVDWTDKPLYSSLDLQTGFTANEMNLFQYVVGDPVPGFGTAAVTRRTSTENDTNISTPGAMASTEEMLVYAIKVEYYGLHDTANDFTSLSVTKDGDPTIRMTALSELQRRLNLRLVISQKVYAEAPLGYFNTGFGPFSHSPIAGAAVTTTQATGNAGLPSQEAVRSYVIPHHIGGQEKYRVSISNFTGAAVNFGFNYGATDLAADSTYAVTLRVLLDGLYKRPVS